MPFDWREFLALARTLAVKGAGEREWRSAISRAYYAAFHRARMATNVLQTAEGSHAQVWGELERSTDRLRKGIGAKGFRLKQDRVRADYRSDSITLTDALAAVQNAESVINALARLREDELGRP